ncbi:MAG: hypothetical protein K2K63_09945 [Acetatifactor sp.]|nr:hypothetical protein [Acetatifactor sp.]
MAANVESMFYVREKPWHGLGTTVAEAPDSTAALRLAGLHWNVVQKDIMTVDGSTAIPGFKANVRDTDGSVLGIVTDFKVRILAALRSRGCPAKDGLPCL